MSRITTSAPALPTWRPTAGELRLNPFGTYSWMRATGSSAICFDAVMSSICWCDVSIDATTRRGFTAPSEVPASTSAAVASRAKIATRLLQP